MLHFVMTEPQAYKPGRGLQAPDCTKTLFFRQMLIFSGKSQQPKMNNFWYLLHKKRKFIPSIQMKCPKSGIFANNYWVAWVGQNNFAG